MKRRLVALITALALVVAGCSSSATPMPSLPASTAAPATVAPASMTPATGAPATAAPASLTIYGASSLNAVLAKVKTVYEAASPGTILTISTDSSTALETKIEQGAPADVFLSADTANPQKLVDKGLAAGGVTKFAGNLLTVIVPLGNPAGIQTPADLARNGVKIVTCGDTVPIAKYAAQLVTNLAKQPGYPADFVAKYTANIVSKQDNVSAVVSQIALGEGDAGIVYVTDAKTSTQVTTVPIPVAANVPATYSGVVVKASANVSAAGAFLTWLAGPDGQAILASFGFLPAP
jgi:molybdate transport system substrate-binding protein